jgi:DNA-binding response OmpR family regulator
MKKQILIVEDQLSTRKLLSHYLGHFFDVIEKDNASDAIDWLKDGHKPNAIIADIIMPEMTGLEFLSQLKSSKTDTPPILMLSSIQNSTEKMKCFHLGARDYVVKPFNPEELRIRINNLINN